jgi:hypothetical protein
VRVTKLASLAVLAVALSACTTIAPQSTPLFVSPITPVPGTSLALPSIALPSLPSVTLPPASIFPTAEPPASEAPTTTPEITPSPTPKPTKKPTPTPSPTPTPVAGDIEVSFQDTSIPDPFYNNTDYTITVYISALGTTDLPNVHVRLVVKDAAVSFKFDTGPIAYGDTYTHSVTVNVAAHGPSALVLSASMPSGYVDTNKANNTKSVDIDIQLAP